MRRAVRKCTERSSSATPMKTTSSRQQRVLTRISGESSTNHALFAVIPQAHLLTTGYCAHVHKNAKSKAKPRPPTNEPGRQQLCRRTPNYSECQHISSNRVDYPHDKIAPSCLPLDTLPHAHISRFCRLSCIFESIRKLQTFKQGCGRF